MNHILTASTQGMKAGYNQRKRTIQRGGLNIAVGSFGDYCQKFGPEVTACKAQMRQPVSNNGGTRVVEEPLGVLVFSDESDELTQLRQRIAEIEAEQQAKAAKPKATRKAKKADKPKVNVWHPWACKKHNIPTTVGATFTYKGKRRTSTFKVTKVTANGVESIRVA